VIVEAAVSQPIAGIYRSLSACRALHMYFPNQQAHFRLDQIAKNGREITLAK